MPQRKEQQIIIHAKPLVLETLRKALEHYNIEDLCCFKEHEEEHITLCFATQNSTFQTPVRIGTIIDHVISLQEKAQKNELTMLDLGTGILNRALGVFSFKKGENKDIALTEKEVDVLCYLHKKSPEKVPREDLLKAVWGYSSSAETHTLETHIYRLRQKIERDSASPVLLKKDEDGYYIKSYERGTIT